MDEQLTEVQTKTRQRGILFPLFLIFLGVLFLANNLGLVPWNVWNQIWKFWPIFLVLLGLQILFRRS